MATQYLSFNQWLRLIALAPKIIKQLRLAAPLLAELAVIMDEPDKLNDPPRPAATIASPFAGAMSNDEIELFNRLSRIE